ncbi:MAG TPA: sigma-70 family RNA polymerase sigma factor, partial [Gemmataceae bacterium]|nr:sigma-70 family RNA polymerase sigma factor [Gemmataceae bacterium]
MASAAFGKLVQHIHKLAAGRCAHERSDHQLLEAFFLNHDEHAFAVMVARHGPMVMRVCKRSLNHEQDAEDTFQAVFLVLAQNAGSIRKRVALAEWLHGVAYRTAMKAKRTAARRRNHEARLQPRAPTAVAAPSWDDVQNVLDGEIQQLPESLRATFVLCVLEGKSGAEASVQLGVKPGTVSSRLTRARQRLQQRLTRRGINLSVLLAALAVSENVNNAVVRAVLANATVQSGLIIATGGMVAGAIPRHIATLASGVSKAMFLTKATLILFMMAATGLVAGS